MLSSKFYAVLMATTIFGGSFAVYLPWSENESVQQKTSEMTHHHGNHKSGYLEDHGLQQNVIVEQYSEPFRNDLEIVKYLKLFGQQMMLWRCKNAIQPDWNGISLPFLDLYCEAIGTLKSVSWLHNGKAIVAGGRYREIILPHLSHGKYLMRWLDFKLRIFNASSADSGTYTFRTEDRDGYREEQIIFVDISIRKQPQGHQQQDQRKKTQKEKTKKKYPRRDLETNEKQSKKKLGKRERKLRERNNQALIESEARRDMKGNDKVNIRNGVNNISNSVNKEKQRNRHKKNGRNSKSIMEARV